jgi:cytochrome b
VTSTTTMSLRSRRLLHWALVVLVALSSLALVDALGLSGLHRPAGYAALALAIARVAWGRVRGRTALASGWTAVLRWVCVVALAFSGWLYTTDMFWGSEAVESVHRALAWGLLALVVGHVMSVIAVRARRRKRAMQ